MASQTTSRLLPTELLRKLDPLSLGNRRRLVADGKGERRSVRRGSSIEFMDYRQYSPGDDLRQVDWNAFGRLGTLHLKLFEEEEVLTVHLLVDASRSMDWGEPNKLDYARQLAAGIAYVALGGYDRVEVTTLGASGNLHAGPVQGMRGVASVFQVLERMESATEPTVSVGLSSMLRGYATQHRRPGMAIVLSDFLSVDGCEAGLSALLQRKFEVVLLHILSKEEIEPTVGGDVRLVDRESGHSVDVTLNQRAIDLYHRRFQAWTGELEDVCRRRQVIYQSISTSTPLQDTIFRQLRERGLFK